MRLVVLLLVLVNLLLAVWLQGGRGPASGGREPQRLERQIAPETIRLLVPGRPVAQPGLAKGTDEGERQPSCLQLGDFDAATLPRIEARLGELALGDRLQSRRAGAPEWFVVHLPATATRADAERLAQELRGRGIRDLIVMGTDTAMPNAIVLGTFRDREQALRHQADLARRGIKGLQVSERGVGGELVRFVVRDADAGLERQLAEVQREFPQSRLGACEN